MDKLLKRMQDVQDKIDRDSITEFKRKSEIVLLLKIILNYCRENHEDYDTLFKLLETSKRRLARDSSFLRKFFSNELPETYSTIEKREIFLYFLKFILRPEVSVESKIDASSLIIYPLLIKSNKMDQLKKVMDASTIIKFAEFVRQRSTGHSRIDIEIL